MKKINWLDTSFTIIGLVLAVISTFNLTGYFENSLDWAKILTLVSLCLGLAIVGLIIYKNKSETKLAKIEKGKLFNSIISEINTYPSNSKSIFLNPSKSFIQFEVLFNKLIEKEHNVSVIGGSDNLISLLSIVSKEHSNLFSRNSYVVNYIQNSFLFILIRDDAQKMSIFLESENYNFVLQIYRKKLIHAIRDTVLRVDKVNEFGINLQNTNEPSKFLSLIQAQKQKFESNFRSLKSGHISFYGTEVQKIQSDWLENGQFKRIRTLDLTSNPGLLLTRDKYIKSNKELIRNNGVIERVFLISRANLKDDIFRNNLKSAIDIQKRIGVNIGMFYLEDLEPNQKQDFILYDDFAVLVEEKQANSDYSFGKSSAYFNSNKINEYEGIFNQVWKGKSKSPQEILNKEFYSQ